MIIFGWGKNCKEIGKGLIRECPKCKNIQQWIIVQTSKKVSLYFVPVARWNKEYFCICPVCNSGIKLDSLEDAHKIMESALKQEAELKKQYLNTQMNPDSRHSYFPIEKEAVPKDEILVENGMWKCKDCHIKMVDEGDYCSKCREHKKDVAVRKAVEVNHNQLNIPIKKQKVPKSVIFVKNGLWECKNCHIKMLEAGDYCSQCREHKKDVAIRKAVEANRNQLNIPIKKQKVSKGVIFVRNGLWECKNCHIKMLEAGDYCSQCREHKKDVAIRGGKMEGLSSTDEKIMKVLKELTYLSEDFHSDMLKIYPNMKNVDAQLAKYCPMMAFYLVFFDLLRSDDVPQEKVKEISGKIGAVLARLNSKFIELIDDCERFVHELIQKYINEEKKEPETVFFAYSYGNWIYYRFFSKSPIEKDEYAQTLKFGDYILRKVMTYWSEQKKSLLPF